MAKPKEPQIPKPTKPRPDGKYVVVAALTKPELDYVDARREAMGRISRGAFLVYLLQIEMG